MTPLNEMIAPVRCTHCNGVYDLCDTEPIHRYLDCTVYKAPCCGRTVDDRNEGWKSRPDFVKLDREQKARLLDLGGGRVAYVDIYGNTQVSR